MYYKKHKEITSPLFQNGDRSCERSDAFERIFYELILMQTLFEESSHNLVKADKKLRKRHIGKDMSENEDCRFFLPKFKSRFYREVLSLL